MTVQELIEQLQTVRDKGRLVVLACDGEGNGHSPCDGLYEAAYKAHTPYRGSVGIEALTPELRKVGYTKDDVVRGEPAVVLSPIV